MKKFFLGIVAIMLSCAAASAQDMQAVVDANNNGAAALGAGDKAGAIAAFEQVITLAGSLGDEAAEALTNAKTYIPQIMSSIAKDLIKEKKYDEGIAQFEAAVAKAAEFGTNSDLADELAELRPQVLKQKANGFFAAKDYANALPALQAVVAADTTDGSSWLRIATILGGSSKVDEALAAYDKAINNGQKAQAE